MTLKKVVKDMGIIGIARILTSISGILLLPVLTRNIGAYGYGLWVQVWAVVGLSIPIIRLGLPYSISRFFPGKSKSDISKDFYSILTLITIVSFTFSLVIYLFPYPLANAVFDGEVFVVRFLAIIIFVRCLDELFISVFRAFREMKKYAVLEVTTRYGEIGLAIILVLEGYGITGALFSVLAARLCMLFVLIFLIGKKIPLAKPNIFRLNEYLRFSLPTIPSNISFWIIETSDRILIGMFLGAAFVGYYSAGYALGKILPFLIIGVLGFVLAPTLSSYYENNELDMVKNVLRLSMKYFLLLSIPYLVGAFVVGRSILLLLTTPEIAREGHIILVFSGFAGIFYAVSVINGQILMLKKKTHVSASFIMVASLFNLGGNIVLIPWLGIIGAGITTILSYLILMVLKIYAGSKYISIAHDHSSTIKVIASSAIMGISIYLFQQYVWANLFVLILLGMVLYFGILFAIGGVEKKEIEFLKGIVGL